MIIEHVPGWIEDKGSVGAFSGEPLEASNKVYREMRRNNARFSLDGLDDALKIMFLRSSPKLAAHFDWDPFRLNHCGNCGTSGHNIRTCECPHQAQT